jgi:hypothetical protein
MPNAVVEGLFILALWVPPVVVAVCALMLLVRPSSPRTAPLPARTAATQH